MDISLPIDFQNRMKELLKDEYDSYIASFDFPNIKGIHINECLTSSKLIYDKFGSSLEIIPNINNGFIIKNDTINKVGTHPLHHAGVIYSQDPSAMMPIASIPFEFPENMTVLDLCAAPGGKSSQLAIKLNGNGYLVSNEINVGRNQILLSNLERMGYKNTIVTNMAPDKLAANFPGAFDLIVIDAPCSGEGMFRKYPESILEWSINNVELCANRQKNIIDDIMPALNTGGYILYSTCTYSKEEDEDIIEYITNKYNLEIIVPMTKLLPHINKGEGQFYCLLKQKNDLKINHAKYPISMYKHLKNNDEKLVLDTINHSIPSDYKLYEYKENVIACNDLPFILPNSNISRFGINIGQIKSKRFVPSHHFFKVFGKNLNNTLDLSDDEQLARKYLHGEEISYSINNGYGIITYYSGVLGGFKSSNNRLKNYYPKGLRNNNV